MNSNSNSNFKHDLLSFAATLLLSLAIVFLIRSYVIQPFFVRGRSMEPNFSDGDYLIINEISYRLSNPKRGDVIVFKFPNDPSQFYIKRIIGLPGEAITIQEGEIKIKQRDGSIFVLQEPYISQKTPGVISKELKDDEFFVLGDNRRESSDSRSWGALDDKFIVGKALLRAWPLETARVFASF